MTQRKFIAQVELTIIRQVEVEANEEIGMPDFLELLEAVAAKEFGDFDELQLLEWRDELI